MCIDFLSRAPTHVGFIVADSVIACRWKLKRDDQDVDDFRKWMCAMQYSKRNEILSINNIRWPLMAFDCFLFFLWETLPELLKTTLARACCFVLFNWYDVAIVAGPGCPSVLMCIALFYWTDTWKFVQAGVSLEVTFLYPYICINVYISMCL